MTSRSFVARNELWCVLLAAGGSRRLGYPKQLLRNPVRPLLLSAVDAALCVAPERTVVVIGSHALRMRALLSRNYRNIPVVYNADWERGISASLQAGIAVLPATARGALITLTDQVLVDTRSLLRIANVWRRRPAHAVAALYGGEKGVPAVLPRSMWKLVRELDGDRGAKALLTSPDTRAVELPAAALDIDEPEDRARFESRRV